MEWISDYFDETDNNHKSGDPKLELRRAGDAAGAASPGIGWVALATKL